MFKNQVIDTRTLSFRLWALLALTLTSACFSSASAQNPTPKAQPLAPNTLAIRPIDPAEAKTISYTLQIHPLLEENCGGCHAAAAPAGGLAVSSMARLLKGGVHGPAIFAGKPDESPLVQYIRGTNTPQMPKDARPLTVDDLHLVRLWISAGAHDDTAEQKAKLHTTDETGGAAANTGPVEDESGLTLEQIRAKHLARLPAPPAVPHSPGTALNEIDRFVMAKWAASKLPAPQLCEDAIFVRRVYLDTIGVIPTAEQARSFMQDKSAGKRARLIDDLLARTGDYAANWIPFWEDALCSNGKHQGGTGTRPDLRGWLTQNLSQNRPYDEMVAELIDSGFPSPTAKQTAGWVRNNDHVETAQSAANVAQVFLGTELKCASCHNHFLNKEWPQRKFMAFASYFSPTDMEVIRCEVHEGEFLSPGFIFNQPAARQPSPKDLAGRLKLVSRLVVDPENPRFARSIVNRLWKRYFGLGLVEPADDFRADRAATHPELLTWLADDFMRHGYDLKHTIRLILNSRTYQLRYDPRLADTFNVSKPDLPRYYRSPGLRRLTCEQLLDSINLAIGSGAPRTYMADESTPLTRALGKPASRNEVSTARPDDVAVVQALELLNGPEFNSRVAGGELAAKLSQEADPVQVVIQAYWSIYSRPPTAAEIAAGKQFLGIGSTEQLAASNRTVKHLASSLEKRNGPGTPGLKPKPQEVTWMEGAAPQGSQLQGNWQWVDNPAGAGSKVHSAPVMAGAQQHFFINSPQPLEVGPGDTLFGYIYIDPAAKPREVMFQWNDGTWEHRAYWGENQIPFGADGTASRLRMGDLPAAGGWVWLEIPANKVGLAGKSVSGMSFDQFDGHVYFGRTGLTQGPHAGAAVIDMLWALMVSPEFQYIR